MKFCFYSQRVSSRDKPTVSMHWRGGGNEDSVKLN